MDEPKAEGVYRNPPVIAGKTYFSKADLGETVDWGLQNRDIVEIQKITTGKGVRIAILDTGAAQHPDIGDLAFMYNMTNSPTPFDMQGHCTHVSGIIRAKANGFGVRGVAPDADIGAIKGLGDDGSGINTWISNGIYKAIDEKVDILSMSLGGGYDPGIAQACQDALQTGIFIVCAAGNDGDIPGQDTIGWPARLGTTIAIGSYNKAGKISDFSSSGPEVDFAFPGEDILSTWLNGQYKVLSGTSMATPFCSGVLALYLAYLRAVSPTQVPKNNSEMKDRLKSAAQDMAGPGHDNQWGWGIPDVDKLVKAVDLRPPPVPVPPPTPVEPTVPIPPDVFFGRFGLRFPVTLDGKTGAFLYFK